MCNKVNILGYLTSVYKIFVDKWVNKDQEIDSFLEFSIKTFTERQGKEQTKNNRGIVGETDFTTKTINCSLLLSK